MTEFTERYKELTNEELLDILANASSYQPIAVKTAKNELLTRGIQDDQLDELIVQNKKETEQKQKFQQQRKKAQKAEMKAFFDPINPFLKGLELHERQIRVLSWIFIALAIYTLYNNFSLMGLYFEDMFNGEIGLYSIEDLLEIFAIVIGAILFWKRMKFGWVLTTFYISCIIGSFVLSLIHTMTGSIHKFNKMIDDFMTADTSLILSLMLLVTSFIVVFYILLKRNVRITFSIKSAEAKLTLFIAFILQVIMWLPIFIH